MKKMLKVLSVIMSLLMIFSTMAVPTFATGTDAPEYPNNENFVWGINGHLDTSASYPTAEIEEQIALAAKLGTKLYRVDINEVTSETDKIVQTANAYGMDVMLVITSTAESSVDEVTAQFTQIANHYATGYFGNVKYINIFNEIENFCANDGATGSDLNEANGYDTQKVADMSARINAAHAAVKAASQDYVTVVNYGWLHDPCLDLLRDAGADWDVIGLQWYTDMEVHSNGKLETALDRLNSYDTLKDKKIIITESNVWQDAGTSEDLFTIMDKAYNSDKVIGMCFYELLDEPDHELESERNFGFVNYTLENGIGEVKPIYNTVQGLIGGSNDIPKGTFTSPDALPTENTVAKAIDGAIAVTGGANKAGTIEFGETINWTNYHAVEFDIYVESANSNPVSFNVGIQNEAWNARVRNLSNVPVNQWVHKIVYIQGMTNLDCGDDVIRFYAENGTTGTIVNITNLNFTNVAFPEMNNTHSLSKELDYELAFDGTDFNLSSKTESTAPVDMSKGYLEFDVFVKSTAETVNFQLFAYDTDGGSQLIGVTVEANKWVHKVVSVSTFSWGNGDMKKIKTFKLVFKDNDSNARGDTYMIGNMALTKDTPNKNNTYKEEVAISTEINSTGATAWALDGTYDLTKYMAVEFDFYLTSSGTEPVSVTFGFKSSSTAARQKTFSAVPVNQWVHRIVIVESLTNGNADLTQIHWLSTEFNPSTAGYSKIKVANISLTNSEYEHYSPKKLVEYHAEASGWGKETSFAGETNFTEYDYVEFDFIADNATSANKIRLFFNNYENTGKGFYDINYTPNTGMHIVVPVSNIECGWGFEGDKTSFGSITLDDLQMVSGASYRISNMALTKDTPNKNNVHKEAVAISKEINASGTAEFSLGDTYDLTKYIAIEADFYVTSSGTAPVNVTLGFKSSPSEVLRGKASNVPVNQWVHKVIYVKDLENADGDKTKIYSLFTEFNPATVGYSNVEIVNISFTKYPDAEYEHYLAKDLVGSYGATTGWNTGASFAEKNDFTKYDYVEFDFIAENATGAKNLIRLWFKNETTNQMGFYDITYTPNTWMHVVVPVSEIDCTIEWGGDGTPKGDKTSFKGIGFTNDYFETGATYRILNMALTTEEEPSKLGDANGDGVIDVRDLVRMKKIAVDPDSYEDITNADVVGGDGMIEAEDLIAMRRYLLGIIKDFAELN